MQQYAKRKIDVIISLGEGQFGDTKGPDVVLSGLRASASAVIYNGDAKGQLQLRIFGMPLAMINQLTRVGPVNNQRRLNIVTVTAGEEGGAMSVLYEGTIISAFGDFNGAPDVVFNVISLAGDFEDLKPIAASSYQGAVDAAVIMGNLAHVMGFSFENNGVSVMLQDRTFGGSAMAQVRECARAARINYTVDRGKLAIWPRQGFRQSDPVKISPATGMVGYPSFSSNGIIVTTIFNPDIQLGRRVDVASDLQVACGIWNVFSVSHTLESETPNGQWFTQVSCYRMQDV